MTQQQTQQQEALVAARDMQARFAGSLKAAAINMAATADYIGGEIDNARAGKYGAFAVGFFDYASKVELTAEGEPQDHFNASHINAAILAHDARLAAKAKENGAGITPDFVGNSAAKAFITMGACDDSAAAKIARNVAATFADAIVNEAVDTIERNAEGDFTTDTLKALAAWAADKLGGSSSDRDVADFAAACYEDNDNGEAFIKAFVDFYLEDAQEEDAQEEGGQQ